MNVLTIGGVKIEGLAACVPAHAVENEAKVAQATGIVTRRIAAKGTTVADLCVKAAEKILADTNSKPEDFGAVLCVSFTQHNRMPATAIEAQVRLGLPKDVVAFDVSLACSGWGYGLYLAGLQLEEGGTIQMDGFGVFKFVATDVVGYLREFLSANSQQLTANSFVPHQPNVYMVRQLAKSLGVAEGTTAISCDQLGNLSSASVPVTIAWKNVRGPVLFSGFGGGLSVSIGMIEIDEDCKLAVIEV